MSYLITNQNNFSSLKYPCPSYPKATVKSGGCGACATLNCVENTTDLRFKMAAWIKYVIKNHGRVDGGTSITAIMKALNRDYGFAYEATNNLIKIKSHLNKGGMAVFHVGGAYSGWQGLLSSEGHYVCLGGISGDGKAIVLDSGWYSGKYAGAWRKARCSQGKQCGVVHVAWENLEKDKKFRGNEAANYFLLKPPTAKDEMEENDVVYITINDVPLCYRGAVKRRISNNTLQGDGRGNINVNETMCRIWTTDDRLRYETLDDIPQGEYRDVIAKLMNTTSKSGTGMVINGKGNGVIDLHDDQVRTFVIENRAGLFD